MKTFEVTLPITGYCYMTVEANSEEEAIDIALADPIDEVESWQVHKEIVSGNVFYGEINEASAQEIPA